MPLGGEDRVRGNFSIFSQLPSREGRGYFKILRRNFSC
jgi:hypothetical protein